MDWGSPSCLPESRLLLLQLLTLLLVMGGGRCEGCQVEDCTSQYGGHQHLQDFQATPELCRLAYAYLRCLTETARSCRGDINFHFVYSWLEKKITQNDCAALLRTTTAESKAAWTPPPTSVAPPPPPPPAHCVWRGRRRFRHCGLFGDPHLKTFDNEYQTCRVRGAWPLIDNPYLAVQVTNEPVIEGSPATATTKVTVIVRGKNTTCTPEKTYEAQSDSPLPAMFIDGTRQSGPDQTVLLTTHDGGARVEISALHIASRVIVRRSGQYLALAAQVPEELALSSSPQGAAATGLQLCARGCPASERLDASGAAARDVAALPWEAAVARCKRSPALNLSFPYLDWCVFDVMTTAADEFVAAARSAQEDVMRLDPGSLNGTAPGFEPGATAAAAAPPVGPWCFTMALLAVLVAGS